MMKAAAGSPPRSAWGAGPGCCCCFVGGSGATDGRQATGLQAHYHCGDLAAAAGSGGAQLSSRARRNWSATNDLSAALLSVSLVMLLLVLLLLLPVAKLSTPLCRRGYLGSKVKDIFTLNS